MATKTNIPHIMGNTPNDGHLKIAKTKIICTLGPKSREVPILEKLLRAGMNVARFNFSHGTHEYQQYTLDNLRQAMENTQILCAVLLDTKVLTRVFFCLSFLYVGKRWHGLFLVVFVFPFSIQFTSCIIERLSVFSNS